jgi:predicted glycosyl hydrolase (DUF1957 family)
MEISKLKKKIEILEEKLSQESTNSELLKFVSNEFKNIKFYLDEYTVDDAFDRIKLGIRSNSLKSSSK